MATQAIGKFAASSAVDSSAATNTHDEKSSAAHQGPVDVTADDFHKSPSETESSDIGDGIFRQHIEKDRKQVSWSGARVRRLVWCARPTSSSSHYSQYARLPPVRPGAPESDCSQLMFTWMAIDRTNVSGVLTSTFLHDTGMTRDQANTGVSLLWFGIVLLEIPSNVMLHREGAHYRIPAQVVVWGLIKVLQAFVTNAGGWYAAQARLSLHTVFI
ncbi:hypothetical protein LA080_016076 [Diaporthe eres]|nr:hypothetical protein LA080_016076 [Diaporthe eres]